MIPVDQTTYDDHGNCLAAAVASVMEMPIAAMPNLRGGDWMTRLRNFLAPMGLRAEVVPSDRMEGLGEVPNVGLGMGPRGRQHAVVCVGPRVAHDPHPSRDGLLGKPWAHLFVV